MSKSLKAYPNLINSASFPPQSNSIAGVLLVSKVCLKESVWQDRYMLWQAHLSEARLKPKFRLWQRLRGLALAHRLSVPPPLIVQP